MYSESFLFFIFLQMGVLVRFTFGSNTLLEAIRASTSILITAKLFN